MHYYFLVSFSSLSQVEVEDLNLNVEDARRELTGFTRSLLQSERRHKTWLAKQKSEFIKRRAKATWELQAKEESLALREEQVKAREERVRELEEEQVRLVLENENLKAQLLAIRNDEASLTGPGSALPAVYGQMKEKRRQNSTRTVHFGKKLLK